MPCSGCLALHGVNPNLKKVKVIAVLASSVMNFSYGWHGHLGQPMHILSARAMNIIIPKWT